MGCNGADHAGEALWRLDDDIDEQSAASSVKLAFLGLQLGQRVRDTAPGLRTDMGTRIQRPIHGRGGKPRLKRDFLDRKAMSHLMYY